MTVVFFEPDGELSLQAVTLAQSLGSVVRAIGIEGPYAPSAWAAALIEAAGDGDIVGPGSDRGNEVLAHVAAQLDLPLAANVDRGARRPGHAHPLGRDAARRGAHSRAAAAADRSAVRLHSDGAGGGSRRSRRRSATRSV